MPAALRTQLPSAFQTGMHLQCKAQPCRRDAKSLLAAREEPDCRPIPTSWWVGGLAAAAVLATAILCPMMDMPAYEPLAAVVLTLLVAVLAVRALGMSDLNPVSGVGKLSQVCLPCVGPAAAR